METEEVLLEEDMPEEIEERTEPLEILYRDFRLSQATRKHARLKLVFPVKLPSRGCGQVLQGCKSSITHRIQSTSNDLRMAPLRF